MADTQALNATFFAFRKREGGGVLLGASIAYIVGMLVLLVIGGVAAWSMLGGTQFVDWYGQAMQAAAKGDAAGVGAPPNMGGMFLMVPLYFVFLFALFVLIASYEAACVRWMVRGERSGPLFLHFGADMWRVYGTYWVWFLYVILGWVGFALIAMLSGFIGASVGGSAGGWIGFGIGAAYVLAWFYATVRFSPASAASVGVGKFAPLKAWDATSGRFWALLGGYVLITIMYLVAYTIVASIFLGAFYAQIFSGIDWTQAQSDPQGFSQAYQQGVMQAMQGMFGSPMSIALYVGGQIAIYAVVMFFMVLYFGVESRAVQAALEDGKIEAEPAS